VEIGKAVAGNSERKVEGGCVCQHVCLCGCAIVCGPYEHVFATFRFVGANLSLTNTGVHGQDTAHRKRVYTHAHICARMD